jgi:hypothetical protein
MSYVLGGRCVCVLSGDKCVCVARSSDVVSKARTLDHQHASVGMLATAAVLPPPEPLIRFSVIEDRVGPLQQLDHGVMAHSVGAARVVVRRRVA